MLSSDFIYSVPLPPEDKGRLSVHDCHQNPRKVCDNWRAYDNEPLGIASFIWDAFCLSLSVIYSSALANLFMCVADCLETQ